MSEEEKILRAFRAMQEAMIAKDTMKMRSLTAPDKTFTHMSGKVQTREEYFREIENGTLNYYGYTIHHPQAEVEDDRALFTADVTLKARVYGFSGSWTLPVRTCYRKIGEEWIQVNG